MTLVVWPMALVSIDTWFSPSPPGMHNTGQSSGIVMPVRDTAIAMLFFVATVALWQAFGRLVRKHKLSKADGYLAP